MGAAMWLGASTWLLGACSILTRIDDGGMGGTAGNRGTAGNDGIDDARDTMVPRKIWVPDCLAGVECDTPWVHDTVEDDSCDRFSCNWGFTSARIAYSRDEPGDALVLVTRGDQLWLARASDAWEGDQVTVDSSYTSVGAVAWNSEQTELLVEMDPGGCYVKPEYLKKSGSEWLAIPYREDTDCRFGYGWSLDTVPRVYRCTDPRRVGDPNAAGTTGDDLGMTAGTSNGAGGTTSADEADVECVATELVDDAWQDRPVNTDDGLVVPEVIEDESNRSSVQVRRWTGSDWQIEPVMKGTALYVELMNAEPLSLYIHSSTPPDFEATVAIRNADGWELTPLPYSHSMIDAVALDRGGRVHLMVDQDYRLLYAEPLESGWKLHEVAFSGARAFALDVGAEGTVTILYYGVSRFALDPIHHLGIVRYNPSPSVQLAPWGPPDTPATHIRCDAIQLGTKLANLTVPNDEWNRSGDDECFCPRNVMKGSGSMSEDGWKCVDAGPGKNGCDEVYFCCVQVDDDDRVTSVGENCDPDP
jgi:hypothetical protein